MIKRSLLERQLVNSPLGSHSKIKPKGGTLKRSLAAVLMVTSLVDAFSILVVYLLMNFSNSGEILYISKDMELPVAGQSDLLERSTTIRLDQGKLYVEDKEVREDQLVSHLIELKKGYAKAEEIDLESEALTIQADRRVEYKALNSIVLAGSQAGFSEIRFAVLAR